MIERPKQWLLSLIPLFYCLAACASSPQGPKANDDGDRYIPIASFGESIVEQTIKDMDDKRVLYAFDIDNTLLTHPKGQFFGSDQWYDWQKSLEDDSPAKIACRLQIQGAAYHMAHFVLTEPNLTAAIVEGLQNAGKDVIALTSRSPQFRYPTERELDKNGIDFTKTMPRKFAGIPGYYYPKKTPNIPDPRDASYQNGIAMLAGQHKGDALVDLLDRIGAAKDYDFVVFFDDKKRYIDQVVSTFSSDSRTAIAFLYTAVDTDLSKVDFKRAIRGQVRVADAYDHFVRRAGPGCDIG